MGKRRILCTYTSVIIVDCGSVGLVLVTILRNQKFDKLIWPEIGRKEDIMSEFTKGELTLKKYRKLDAVYLGDKCIIKMAFPDYAKELVRRWNSQPALLAACERALKESHNPKVEIILDAAIALCK